MATQKKLPKTRVAKSTAIKRGAKFDWKVIVGISVVLVAALGYLYVRLSRAAGGDLSWNLSAATNVVVVAGEKAQKADGRAGVGTLSVSGNQFAAAEAPYHRSSKRNGSQYCVEGYAASTATVGVETADYSMNGRNLLGVTHQTGSPARVSRGNFSVCSYVNDHVLTNISNPLTRIRASIVSDNNAGRSYIFRVYTVGLGIGGTTPTPNVTPAPPVASNSTLCQGQNVFGLGSQGDCVRLIQQQLVNLGYNIGSRGVDGYFGQDTVNAVKAYQNKAGLPVDGAVGVQTWNSMFGNNPARKN